MRVSEIMHIPTSLDHRHESLYRAHHILQKVKTWLQRDVPPALILELIEDMEAPAVTPPFDPAPDSETRK